jgi:hypothetical protein
MERAAAARRAYLETLERERAEREAYEKSWAGRAKGLFGGSGKKEAEAGIEATAPSPASVDVVVPATTMPTAAAVTLAAEEASNPGGAVGIKGEDISPFGKRKGWLW